MKSAVPSTALPVTDTAEILDILKPSCRRIQRTWYSVQLLLLKGIQPVEPGPGDGRGEWPLDAGAGLVAPALVVRGRGSRIAAPGTGLLVARRINGGYAS